MTSKQKMISADRVERSSTMAVLNQIVIEERWGRKEDAERGESYSDAHERYFDAPDWENAMGTTKERKNNLIDWVYTKRALR